MDAGVLDVLHDAADDDPLPVGDGVDIGLEGILEKAVDQHGPLLAHPRRRLEVVAQGMLIVDDLHGPAAEDERRTHQYRVPDALGHRDGVVDAGGGAVLRLPNAELADDRLEALPVLGDVDGVGRRPEDAHPGVRERPSSA